MLNHFSRVMAVPGLDPGIVPAIYVLLPPPYPPPLAGEGREGETWMPAKTGSPPRHAAGCHCAGMTRER